jgi:hypothetical protein
MSNIFLIQNLGNTIWFDGKPWNYVGPDSQNAPNASLDAANGDAVLAGSPQLFSVADAQGRSQYTGAEQILAEQMYRTSITIGNAWTTFLNPVPVSGVLRIWWLPGIPNYNPGIWTAYARVNGIDIPSNIGDGFANALPINVDAGQHVSVRFADGTFGDIVGILIPFAYTPPV